MKFRTVPPFFINYSLSIKEIINGDYRKLAPFSFFFNNEERYSKNNAWISAAQRSLVPKELIGRKVNINGALFISYNIQIDRDFIVEEMKKEKYRPANVYELLALSEACRSNKSMCDLGIIDNTNRITVASIDFFPYYNECLAIRCYKEERQLILLLYGPKASNESGEVVYYFLGIRE